MDVAVCLFLSCLASQQHAWPISDLELLTVLHAGIPRLKLQIKLVISPYHSVLTLGQQVPNPEPEGANTSIPCGMVASRVPNMI